MTIKRFFSALETASSEVGRRNVFQTEPTIYIPDFFFIFFYMISFCFSVLLDVSILIFLFLYEQNIIWGSTLLVAAVSPVICQFFVEAKSPSGFKSNDIVQHILTVMGFRSVLIFAKVLKKLHRDEYTAIKPISCFSFSVFHISNENLSLIKIYCCINSAVKSIPNIYLMTFLALSENISKNTALLATGSILLNMILFSFSISILFPIRKTPRIFTTTVSFIFSAINKFMAAMCACCVNLALLAILITSLRYLAMPILLAKTLIWVWPCWRVLRSQPVRLGRAAFATYLVFLTLLMSIIYIHPFEGQGKLYYYFFYLLSIFLDLTTLYLYTEASLEAITVYYTLRILMIGFLSCFGLLNILHKQKTVKYDCMTVLSKDSGLTIAHVDKEKHSTEDEQIEMERSELLIKSQLVDKDKNSKGDEQLEKERSERFLKNELLDNNKNSTEDEQRQKESSEQLIKNHEAEMEHQETQPGSSHDSESKKTTSVTTVNKDTNGKHT